MCDGNWAVNGIEYPCAKCVFNEQTEGTCDCRTWRRWFKAYWKALRKKYRNAK